MPGPTESKFRTELDRELASQVQTATSDSELASSVPTVALTHLLMENLPELAAEVRNLLGKAPATPIDVAERGSVHARELELLLRPNTSKKLV